MRTANGEFWFAEEYSPSIVRPNAIGRVIERAKIQAQKTH